MNPHNALQRLTESEYFVLDPGDGAVIPFKKQFQTCSLTVAGTETRVLPTPTGPGLIQSLFCAVNAGADTCTITVANSSAVTGSGDTSIAFNAVDDFVMLKSFDVGGDAYEWRVIAAEGSPASLGDITFEDITATSVTTSSTITAADFTTNATEGVISTDNIAEFTATVGVSITGLVAKSDSAAAISAARVLTASDSGGTFSVAKTSAYAITLPTPSQGLSFKFVVVDTGANIVTISDGSAHLLGTISINNVNTAATGTTIGLASGGSIGDWVQFEGISATQYLVTGACIAASDITVT